MSEIAADVCTTHFIAGDVLKVDDTSRRVLQLLEAQHREKDVSMGWFTTYSSLCGWRGIALGCLGKFEEGKAVLEKGLNNALEVNDSWGTGWLEVSYSTLSFQEGYADATIDHACKAIKYFKETGVAFLLGQAWSCLGAGYFLLGKHEEARDNAEKGVEFNKEAGLPAVQPFLEYILALIHLAARDLESARGCAEEALKLSREYKTKTWEALTWTALGKIVGEADPSQINVAEQYIRQGISMAEETSFRSLSAQGYLLLGELFTDTGRREEALESLKKAETMYQEMGVTPQSYWLKRTQEALARLEPMPGIS
jgi:tetratricopeptide (TPR) repeat protein